MEIGLRGVIKCALHSGVNKSLKNQMCFEMQKVKVRVKFNIFLQVRFSNKTHVSKDQIKIFYFL